MNLSHFEKTNANESPEIKYFWYCTETGEKSSFTTEMKRYTKPVPAKVQFIPNPADRAILQAGRDKHGIKLTEVIRMALRRFAESEGMEVKAS